MRIALIFSGNSNTRSGKFNQVFERAKKFQQCTNDSVDVFFIQKTYAPLFKLLKKNRVTVEEVTVVDKVSLNNIWLHQTLWEYLLVHKIKGRDIECKEQIHKYLGLFKDYDLLSVNGSLGAYLALMTERKYGVPFVITWHGSDINVYPYRSKAMFKLTEKFMKAAKGNIFVSKSLLKNSNRITKKADKKVIYYGPADRFFKKTEAERRRLRKEYKINFKYVIGFVGNMKLIKNVLLLPDIFERVQKRISDVGFLCVGSGPQLPEIEKKVEDMKMQDFIFMGRVNSDRIPEVMNCIDILVFPSKKEGLGLVALEAQICGAHVVGSKIGGIPEIIPAENAFELGTNFISQVVNRIVELLETGKGFPQLEDKFSLISGVKEELQYYKR